MSNNNINSITKSNKRKKSDAAQNRPTPSQLEIGKDQQETLRSMNILCGQVFAGNTIRWLDRTVINGEEVQRLLSKPDFASAKEGRFVLGNDGEPVPVAKWYQQHPERMIYDEIIFDPARYFADKGSKHVYDSDRPNHAALNLFTGWAVKPKAFGSCELFYQHLRDNYTSGDPVILEAVLDWMAHLVQRPGKPIGWALAVVGDMGSGKSVVSDVLATIIGKKYAPVFTTPEQMLGKFNAAMGQCILARVEEAFNPRDKRHVATLRNLLSGGDTLLELKGVDAITVTLRANAVFTSNDPHFLTAGSQGERRYLAFRCGNGAQQNGAYFKALKQQMERGGYAKLLDDLMARDISAVDFTSPPRTAVLSQQIRASLTGLERWWADCLEAGELIFAREPADVLEPLSWEDWGEDHPGRSFSPAKTAVVASAAAYARDYTGRAPSPAEVGKFLTNNAGVETTRTSEGRSRVQRYVFPGLDECRSLFADARPGLRKVDLGCPDGDDRQDSGEVVQMIRAA